MTFTEFHRLSGMIGSTYSYSCIKCRAIVSGVVVNSYPSDFPVPLRVAWLMCPHCGTGAVRQSDDTISPSGILGEAVEGLSTAAEQTYAEACKCMTVAAYTACELMCRKLIMHMGAENGANPRDPFGAHLTALEDAGFITAPVKSWADRIRGNGNDATHGEASTTKERAADTMAFTVMLLRLVYEMPHRQAAYVLPGEAAQGAIPP